MQISIAERLKPFCHLPGTSTILPRTGYQVQLFPCLIRIYHLKKAFPILLAELSLELKGPVEQFTLCNDLEKGRLTVWGKTAEGWIRYHLMSSQQKGVRLFIERAPSGRCWISQEQDRHLLHDKEWLDILDSSSPFIPYQIPSCDRLSLGNHKAQDWELVNRRLNLTEIFPIWHRLGQLLPSMTLPNIKEGSLVLLEACQKSLIEGKPEHAELHWLNLFRGGFNSLLNPQLEDIYYQGLVDPSPLTFLEVSPLVLLTEGARLIRQLFIQQERDQILILPFLFPCFPCGRLLDVPLEGGGMLSFEWTKKSIRRLILDVEHDRELTLKFRSHVRSYRLRQHSQDKGERIHCPSSLFLKKNHRYLFDNFK